VADKKPTQLLLFARATKNASWVARHLNTSHQTIARMIEEGLLQGYKLRERGAWHIFLDSVEDFEKSISTRYGIEGPQKGGV
jgi:hypothetical protein